MTDKNGRTTYGSRIRSPLGFAAEQMRNFALVALSILFLIGTLHTGAQEKTVEDVTAREAYKLMTENLDNPDFFIIDVRTADEYKEGHLKGAVNIDLYSEAFKEDIAKLDREKTYLVYCRSGNRSMRAVSLMQELEFTRLYHLNNGIIEWNKEGLPLEKTGGGTALTM